MKRAVHQSCSWALEGPGCDSGNGVSLVVPAMFESGTEVIDFDFLLNKRCFVCGCMCLSPAALE